MNARKLALATVQAALSTFTIPAAAAPTSAAPEPPPSITTIPMTEPEWGVLWLDDGKEGDPVVCWYRNDKLLPEVKQPAECPADWR